MPLKHSWFRFIICFFIYYLSHFLIKIKKNWLNIYYMQILKTGFFNGDPHLAIDSDESLIYYVFGMIHKTKINGSFLCNLWKRCQKGLFILYYFRHLYPNVYIWISLNISFFYIIAGYEKFDKSWSTSTYRRHNVW